MTLKDLLEDERAEGFEMGVEKGREQGRAEGPLTKTHEMAKAMLLENIPLDIVSKVSGLSRTEIESLNLVSTQS